MIFLTWPNPEQLFVAQDVIKNKDYCGADIRINNIDPKLIKKFKSFQTFEYIRKGLKEVLDIEIDQDEILSNACIKRHEIIHRNSVLSDGDIIVITKDQLELIVKHLEMFINNLASKFREIKLDRYINLKSATTRLI